MNSLRRKALLASAGGLAVFLVAGWFCWNWDHRMAAASLDLTRQYRLNEKLRALLSDTSGAGDALKSFLAARKNTSRSAYGNLVYSAKEKTRSLRKETGWNASQQARLDQLDFLVNAELEAFNPVFPPKGRALKAPSRSLKAGNLRNIHKVHRMAADLQTEVAALLAQKTASVERLSAWASLVFWAGFGVDLGILAFLSFLLLRSINAEAHTREEFDRSKELVGSLERDNSEISLLDDLVKSLQACMTVEEVAKTSIFMAQAIFTGVSGNILTLGNSKTQVESLAVFGKEAACKASFEMDECWALRRSQVHLVNHQRNTLFCQHFKAGTALKEYICVPLAAQGKLLGMLHLSSVQEGRLQDRQEKLASLMGEQIALALANIKLREELKSQSIRDPLTGLFNRRFLEESLEKEVAVADRKKGRLCVLMIDIDHFKQFNDKFGHEAGDRVLSEIGSLLNRSVRKGDIACRYGGEELVLLFPDTGPAESRKAAEKLRESVKQMAVTYLNTSLGKITVSVGAAVYPEDGRTALDLLRQADIALYNAKSLGRDKVVLWQDISPEQRAAAQNLAKDLAEETVFLTHQN